MPVDDHWYTGTMLMSTHLSHQAYAKLRALIMDGSLQPGASLSERNLAERLGIGRMPVREAVRELAKDGLVATSPGRGTFVRQLTVVELRELYEARQAIEGMTAFLATKRGPTPRLLAFRERLQERLDGDVTADLHGTQEIGHDFHLAIVEAARNKELSRILQSLQARITLAMRMAADHNPDRIPISLREHIGILDAIESGDASEAQRRMIAHLAMALDARIHLYGAID